MSEAPEQRCDWCGCGPPLFEHTYLDGTRRLCERCKADAIDEEERSDFEYQSEFNS